MPAKTVYILGSGFSASFGLPTLKNLFQEMMLHDERPGEMDKEQILNALLFLYPHFDETHPCYPPFEEFLSLVEVSMDFEGTLFENGHWKLKKKSSLRLLTDLLNKLSAPAEKSELLKTFVTSLKDGDVVITFNWDCLIERMCFLLNRRINFLERDSSAVSLFKLHGSLNWGRAPKELGLTKPATARWLLDDRIFVVNEYKYLDSWDQLDEGPFIVPPTTAKKPLDDELLNRVWYEAFCSLVNAEKIIVVGYSLPPEDLHARALLISGVAHTSRGKQITVVDPNASVGGRYFEMVSPALRFIQGKFGLAVFNKAIAS